MNDDDRDIGPDNGRRPPFAKPVDEDTGAVGTGTGYSGQEYDSKGQAEWRAEQSRADLPHDGVARGSGAGAGGGHAGEDFDDDAAGGSLAEKDAG